MKIELYWGRCDFYSQRDVANAVETGSDFKQSAIRRGHLPLNALRAFEVAGRCLSMTVAGEELAVTHGAISRQIRNLERYLGIQLFERIKGRLRLTPQGQALHIRVQHALSTLSEAMTFADREDFAEVLHLGCTRTIACAIIIPNLGEFRLRYPDMDIVLHELQPSQADIPGVIDIAFCYEEPNPYKHNVDWLCEVRLFPICSPVYLNRISPFSSPSEVRLVDLIHDDDGSNWERWLQVAEVEFPNETRNIYYVAPTLSLQAARYGQGVALSQMVEVTADLERGSLVRLFKDIEINAGAYYIAVRNLEPLPRRIRAFETWARDRLFPKFR